MSVPERYTFFLLEGQYREQLQTLRCRLSLIPRLWIKVLFLVTLSATFSLFSWVRIAVVSKHPAEMAGDEDV